MEIEVKLSDGKQYLCLIKESRRAKSVFLERTATGELTLIVPCALSLNTRTIENILLKNESWIFKTQKEELVIPDTLLLPALEEEWTITCLTTGVQKPKYTALEERKTLFFEGIASVDEAAGLVHKFILSKAKKFLPQRLAYCYAQFGFSSQGEKLKIAVLKSRWGSYSTKNVLTLNARLLYLPIELVDYIIVHELCHIVHLNHSKDFYALLEEKLPNYKLLEQKIKNYTLTPFLWL